MELNCKMERAHHQETEKKKKHSCTYHWHAVIVTGSGHLEFLAVGDFIRQTPDAIVSPVHLQPGNLLQQGLVPPSVVPDQRGQVSSGVVRGITDLSHGCPTVSPVMVCGEDSRQRQALSLHNF